MTRLVLLALALAAPAAAQSAFRLTDDATLRLSGGIQPRVGLGFEEADGTERLGLGLRRARLQFRLTLLERVGMEYDIDTAPGDLRSVDLFAFWDVAPGVQLRAGRLPPGQPRGFIPTSYSRIDAVDRSPVDELWAAGTLGSSGRDISLDLTAERGGAEYQLTLHNGTGGFARDTDNFRESGSASSVTRGADETDLALSASVHRGGPSGLSFGGFGSLNARGSGRTALAVDGAEPAERGYGSAGAHVYFGERPGSQPLRLKLEGVATRYEAVGGFAQQAAGVGAFGAARAFGHGEVFLRGDAYWTDVEGEPDVFGTVGASYSAAAALGRSYRDLRVTGSYLVRRSAAGEIGQLVKLQGQIIF